MLGQQARSKSQNALLLIEKLVQIKLKLTNVICCTKRSSKNYFMMKYSQNSPEINLMNILHPV